VFQPFRVGQAALDGVARKQALVDMQIGRMQGLRSAPGTRHQHADLGEGRFGRHAGLADGALHVAQVRAAVTRLVLAEPGVDLLDDRLGMPFAGAAIPVVKANFAAEMQHQRFQRRRRLELETHLMQFGLGRHQFGPKAPQVLHQHQRMFLLFKKPDRYKGREITVAPVVAQKHLCRRQGRPLGNRIHLDGLGLLVGQLRGIETGPGNILVHVPANGLQLFEQFGIKH